MFFTDHNIELSSKIGITSLLSNITTREGSHKGGWARLLKCQLLNAGYKDVKILDNKDALSDFNVIIFDLGAEYSGALNLFGGLDEKVFKRLSQIRIFTGKLFSWKHHLPDVSILESRRLNQSTCESFKQTPAEFLGDVSRVLSNTMVFQHTYKTNNLLIGDSHTPSVWTPEFMIERQDGRTLYGALKDKTINRLVKSFDHEINTVQIHMSSIDIRHHLCRQPRPDESLVNMLNELGRDITDLRNQNKIKNVVFTQTMGIEDESRELPKTGFYKGTPFYGSWHDRNELRLLFNAKIKEVVFMHNRPDLFEWTVVEFPFYFFDKEGKLGFHVMEKPGSVHLSPEFYRWDLDKNELRWSSAHLMIAQIQKDMYGA